MQVLVYNATEAEFPEQLSVYYHGPVDAIDHSH